MCAGTVIAAVRGLAVVGSFVREQGLDSRRRRPYDPEIGNLSMDWANGMDET